MQSVVLIGTGNVSHHLFEAFLDTSVQIIQVYGRNSTMLEKFGHRAKITTNIDEIIDADVYIVAVNDDAIKSISENLKHKYGLVVHTSGAISIAELKSKRKGVFYPLQSLTKDSKVDFSNNPICIEAGSDEDLKLLKKLALQVSNNVQEITSEQRKKLHLAAVFANNFTNHMFEIAQKLCESEKISFELLKPLIHETANKIRFLDPGQAQTGPAKRNDVLTMQRHLEELNDPMHKKIYQIISESIKRSREEKL